MIQAMIAIILLAGAIVFYLWSRRVNNTHVQEDPDVILGLTETVKRKPEIAQPQSSPSLPKNTPPLERVILFIRASLGRQYGGYELLQSLLSCGLRFGENNIFHRYEQRPSGQVIMFSIAAATKTGELKLADIGEFSCLGLSLFLNLNEHVYPSVNFELMLDTGRQLTEDLGGTLLDERQTVLTQEKVQDIREKIKSFETSQQSMELFV